MPLRLIKLVLSGLILVTAFLGVTPSRKAYGQTTPAHEPGQIVIRLSSSPGDGLAGINQTYGTLTLDSLYGHTDIFLLQAPLDASVEQLIGLMSTDPRLAYAEPNFLTDTPEDGSTDRIYGWGGEDATDFNDQDATDKLRLETAHTYSQGRGALVAVLDTGVQLDHPALSGRLSRLGFDFIDNDPIPADDPNGLDDDGDGRIDEMTGHGTHVAGIAHLVAPEAMILPLRVLNSDGRGNNFKTASAILYAAYQEADAINLSLGTASPSTLLRDAVREAAQMGVVVVAAAGNSNSTIPQYPAAQACAIGVTSANAKDKKSSFANYGDWVDIAAPGEGIYSTFPVDGYAWWSGTSMSTPFVAGQAALLRSVNGGLTLNQIGQLIGGTARSIDKINPAYRGLLGAGAIDLVASLQAQASGSWPPASRDLLINCAN